MLSERELLTLSGSFYDAAADTTEWERVLLGVALTLGSLSSDLYLIEDGAPKFAVIGSCDQIRAAESNEEFLERFMFREPRSLYLRDGPAGRVVTDLDLITSDQMRRHDYYRDFLTRYDSWHSVFCAPVKGPELTCFFGVHFHIAADVPGRDVIRGVAELQTHVARAVQLQTRLEQSRLRNEIHNAVFETLASGIVVLDAKGRVLSENAAARRMLRAGHLAERSGRLTGATSGTSARLAYFIRNAVRREGTLGGSALFQVGEREYLRVTVLPTPAQLHEATGAAAMVFMVEPGTARQGDRETELGTLFALTPTEARIALALADGASPREIGDIHGIAYETVRTILKSVYLKTGTSRQAELVSLVHRIPASVVEPADGAVPHSRMALPISSD